MSSISKLALIVLALCIGYVFIYPSFGNISTLSNQKQKYEDSLQVVNNIESKKQELLTEFNAIPEDERKNVETVLPSSLDFVKLISQIDAVAAKYGISINKITSTEVSSSIGDSIAVAEAPKSYQSSVIGFSFMAPYDKFNYFLSDLEKSLRILDVKTIKIGTQTDGTYTYDVAFETYWLK